MREQRRLEIPVQGKFRQDADRFSPRRCHRLERPPSPRPKQATQFPGKENAGTHPLPAGQRTGYGQELARDRSRRPAQQSIVKMQAALSGSVEHGSLAARIAEIVPPFLPYSRKGASRVIECNGSAAAMRATT